MKSGGTPNRTKQNGTILYNSVLLCAKVERVTYYKQFLFKSPKTNYTKQVLCNSFSMVVILSPFISAVAYHATALMNCCCVRETPGNNSYVCYFCPRRFNVIHSFIRGSSFCFLFFVPLARKKSKPKELIIFSIKTSARGKEKNNIIPKLAIAIHTIMC